MEKSDLKNFKVIGKLFKLADKTVVFYYRDGRLHFDFKAEKLCCT